MVSLLRIIFIALFNENFSGNNILQNFLCLTPVCQPSSLYSPSILVGTISYLTSNILILSPYRLFCSLIWRSISFILISCCKHSPGLNWPIFTHSLFPLHSLQSLFIEILTALYLDLLYNANWPELVISALLFQPIYAITLYALVLLVFLLLFYPLSFEMVTSCFILSIAGIPNKLPKASH